MTFKSLRLSPLPILFALFIATAAIHAQSRDTLGIASFDPPAGWTREVGTSSIAFSSVNKAKGTWCQLGVFATINSRGGVAKDFETDWNDLVAKKYKATGPTNIRDDRGPDGQERRTGGGIFSFNGSQAIVALTTTRVGKYSFSWVVLSNDLEAYLPTVERFRTSIAVTLPKDAPMNGAVNPPPKTSGGGGFAFTTTNFDDGWTSVEERDWVRATKGSISVFIHYPVKEDSQYFPQTLEETLFFWNKLVAPRYSNLRNFQNVYNSGFEAAHFATATVRDPSGKDVYVALFKKKGTYWMEIVTPNKSTFVQNFGKDPDSIGPYETDWNSLVRLAYYNRFAIGASDLSGKWTSDFSGLTQYVNSQTGLSAGTDTHTSRETFVFGAGSSYSWELGVASGYVGSIGFKTAKSAGRFNVPSNWQISFSDIERKPKTYNAYFSSIRGGRILWLDGTGFGKSR